MIAEVILNKLYWWRLHKTHETGRHNIVALHSTKQFCPSLFMYFEPFLVSVGCLPTFRNHLCNLQRATPLSWEDRNITVCLCPTIASCSGLVGCWTPYRYKTHIKLQSEQNIAIASVLAFCVLCILSLLCMSSCVILASFVPSLFETESFIACTYIVNSSKDHFVNNARQL